FPNLKFHTEANMEKYLKLVDYHVVREKAIDCTNLKGLLEIVELLQQRQWERLNNLLKETNNTIGLEFYENDTFLSNNSYTSYVRDINIVKLMIR
ncbi:hypothetical protein RYX36_019390, partial [Vicia faba]